MSDDKTPDEITLAEIEAEADAEAQGIWDEMDAADNSTGADEAAPVDDGFGANESDDDPGDAEPEPKVSTEKAGAAKAAPAEKATATTDGDIWADAPEPMRAAYQSLTKERDEERARRAGNDRKIREMSEELKALRSAPAAQAGSKPDGMNEAEWQAFKEDYAEIAAPIESKMQTLNAELESFRRRFESMDQDQLKQTYDTNFNDVVATHDDYLPIVRQPAFVDWIGQQPRYIQDAAARNGQEIVDPVEVIEIIDRYKLHAGIDAKAPEPKPDDPAKGKTQSLKGKRERQFSATAGAGSTTAPPMKSGIPQNGSQEEIWEAMDREDERKALLARR
jgi:hypothetical protein